MKCNTAILFVALTLAIPGAGECRSHSGGS